MRDGGIGANPVKAKLQFPEDTDNKKRTHAPAKNLI
jgi:hypothetical protein